MLSAAKHQPRRRGPHIFHGLRLLRSGAVRWSFAAL